MSKINCKQRCDIEFRVLGAFCTVYHPKIWKLVGEGHL